jgi:hypothetical protein
LTRAESLKEAIFGTPKKPEPLKTTNVLIITDTERTYGSPPPTTFKSQLDYFMKDPVIKETILQSAHEVCTSGFYTTANEKYTLKLGGKSAKEVIDEWNKENDIDNKLLQISTETIAFGNSVWKIDDGGFSNVPIQAVEKAVAVDQTTSIREKYNLKMTGTYHNKELKNGEFINFATNLTGEAPLGTGIMYGLLARPEANTPSLIEKRMNESKAMSSGFMNFGQPMELYSFDNLDSGSAVAFTSKLKEITPGKGQRLVSTVPGKITTNTPNHSDSYGAWLEKSSKEFYLAVCIGMSPNTEYSTKASAETLEKFHENRIASYQRAIKRKFENLWAKVLDELGYDGKQADIRMNFGKKAETSYTPADILAAKEAKIISAEEARKLYIESIGWKIESTAVPKEIVEEPVIEKPVEDITPVSKKEALIDAKIALISDLLTKDGEE